MSVQNTLTPWQLSQHISCETLVPMKLHGVKAQKESTGNLRSRRSAPDPQAERFTSHAQVLSSISILILYQLFPSPPPTRVSPLGILTSLFVCIRLLLHMLHFLPIQYFLNHHINHLTPNGHYIGRTAQLTSRCCILCIYSTNISTEYFKHAA